MEERAAFPIEAHVVALRFDALDIRHRHAQEAAAIADPEFLLVARAFALVGFLAQRIEHGGQFLGATPGVLGGAALARAIER